MRCSNISNKNQRALPAFWSLPLQWSFWYPSSRAERLQKSLWNCCVPVCILRPLDVNQTPISSSHRFLPLMFQSYVPVELNQDLPGLKVLPAWSWDVVIHRGQGTVASPDLSLAHAQALKGLRAGDLEQTISASKRWVKHLTLIFSAIRGEKLSWTWMNTQQQSCDRRYLVNQMTIDVDEARAISLVNSTASKNTVVMV